MATKNHSSKLTRKSANATSSLTISSSSTDLRERGIAFSETDRQEQRIAKQCELVENMERLIETLGLYCRYKAAQCAPGANWEKAADWLFLAGRFDEHDQSELQFGLFGFWLHNDVANVEDTDDFAMDRDLVSEFCREILSIPHSELLKFANYEGVRKAAS